MADSTTPIQQVIAGTGAAVQVNENFDAASPALIYGRWAAVTTGLTWGYIGGRFGGSAFVGGTVTLAASATNYLVAALGTGVVSVSTDTANWLNSTNYVRLYKIVTGTNVTSYEDHRAGPGGVFGSWAAFVLPETVGTKEVLQNSKSADYTLVLSDSGKHIYHPPADTVARTWTIPSNAAVAYPIGTVITFDNDYLAGVITIACTSDTLVLIGTAGSTGSRTLASGGQSTAIKVSATRWRISGVGLS